MTRRSLTASEAQTAQTFSSILTLLRSIQKERERNRVAQSFVAAGLRRLDHRSLSSSAFIQSIHAGWVDRSGPYSLTMADERESSKQAEFEGGEVLFCGATDWAMIGRQANKPKKGDPPVGRNQSVDMILSFLQAVPSGC